MRRILLVVSLMAGFAVPAGADEFEEAVEGALDAYRKGEVSTARDDLTYAIGLLNQLKAEELAGFLPEPLEGWTRELEEAASTGMAMFGGGTGASASYSRGDEEFTLTLMADSPMISGMAAMFSGMASMAGSQSLRIQRQQFAISDGEISGVIDGRILVQAEGTASTADMQAHIEAMDLSALADY